MAHDATALLGSPQIAGVTVESVGYARRQAAAAIVVNNAGPLAGAARNAVDPHGDQAQTPKFGAGFIAVTDTDLALITLRSTATRLVLGEIVSRVARAAVASVEIHGRFPVSLMTIELRDGTTWRVEVAAVHGRAAKKVAKALNAPAATA